jgi:hypothetical protein
LFGAEWLRAAHPARRTLGSWAYAGRQSGSAACALQSENGWQAVPGWAGLVRRHMHLATIAIVYGTAGPARAVYCDPDTDPPGQRYFSVWLSDASGELDAEPDEAPVCAHCLIDDFPELGRGFDLAVEVKGAVLRDRESGEWAPPPDGDLHPEDFRR